MKSFRSFEPRLCRALVGLLMLALGAGRALALPAFPGAEGFGANASGGRGGTVYHVTNLNDSGTGSFRDAVSVAGRTIVFDVGGIITISSPVVVKPNITIAGQTAPGDGVTIYGDRLSYSDASNTITRYIRYREGINGDSGTDAVGAASGDTMMFDHVSASWGRDETFSLSGTPSNITLQDCIIGQGLLVHSAGSLMQTSGGVSIFRCLYTDNWMRNPKVKGVNDYENNVVYNWGSGGGFIPAGDSAGLSYVNMIGCYFVAGPSTPAGASPFKSGNLNFSLYHTGNMQDLNVNGTLDGTPVTDASFPTLNIVGTPFNYPKPATVLTAEQAFAYVMTNAGASLRRDHADSYMITELASIGTSGAQIYDESAIGGVGTVAGGITPKDTDGDGMPDWWEEAAGTDPLVADNNGDVNGDGYTNLENYLNALAPAGVQVATIDGLANDTGASSTDGVTSDNRLVLRGTAPAASSVTLSRVDLGPVGTTTADATGHWTFDYSSTPLPDRYYAFQATVALPGGQVSPPTRAFVVKVDTTAAAAPTITSITASPSITVSGTSEPGSIVTVMLAGTAVGTAVTDGLGNWSAPYSGPALAPGAYAFTAKAVDLAGNAGPDSAPYSVDTSLAAPVFTGIVSDNGASSTDQITNDATLVLNGTSFPGATVTVTRIGVGVIGTATAGAGGAWAFDYTGTTLPAGTHTFTATAANGGTASPASAPFVVTVDTTKPTVASIRRQNPTTTATTASTVVFRVTFSEPVTGVDAGDFSLTLSGVTGTISSLDVVSSSVFDVTVTGVAGDGTVRLNLKSSGTGIVDVAGNAISGGYTSGQTYTIRLPGSGVWIESDSGGMWSDSANWQGGIVANGTGATADFAQQNIDGPMTVQLDAARTVGRVVFGDSDWTTPAQWTLSDNGAAANVLTLAGATPTLQVDAATSASGDTVDVPAAASTPSFLDVVLVGSAGFTKTGVGTLQIIKPATISGPLTITKGIVQVGPGGSLSPTSVTIATSQQLRIAGGVFSTTGDVTWNSGTGTGIIVSDGTASFGRILPSNARNSFVKVTGGTMTATEINFPRSGDSESQALAAGIQISGGDTTVGTIGLGTNNSWGAMTISGGRLTVTGPVNVGYQATAGRGADVVVSGGEFTVTDVSSTGGLILGRNPGTQPNNVAKFTITGGVNNIARLVLGYDATSTAGSATVSLTNGELNLGSGGIVKNGTSGMTTSVTLNSGVLGAVASWATAHPIVVAGAPASLAIRAGDAASNPHDIALSGPLAGAGGFAKTGGGALTLAGLSSYAGATDVDAGALRVSGTLAAGGDVVTVNPTGVLAGNGTINRAVVLNSGGAIAPDGTTSLGTLTVSSLQWNGGGALAFDLGATGACDTLAIGGALTRGDDGTYSFVFTPGAGFAVGNTYTLLTFASTTFADARNFSASGLPAGTGALFILKDASLQLRIQGTPAVTSAATAAGTFGAPFSYTVESSDTPATYGATGLPPGLTIDPATGVISGTPAAAGVFHVTLAATNTAGTGTAPLTLSVAKAVAPIVVGSGPSTPVRRFYTGQPIDAPVATTPAGLAVTFTYNGEGTAPTLPGTYAVNATIDDPNYEGSATGTMIVVTTALVRHGGTLDGDIDGSIQIVSGESYALNSTAMISSDLLVPGTPSLLINGHPNYVGVKDGLGATSPSGYSVILNNAAVLRYLVRRVDPVALAAVTAPRPPTGTRSVVLNRPTDNPGDFSTIANLTLNGSAGTITLPAGRYGVITANRGNSIVLGDPAATEPALYELQSLTLNGGATLRVAGPVILRLAYGLNANGVIGTPDHPEWLALEIYSGGLTLNSGAVVAGSATVPSGMISIARSAMLLGHIQADTLTINSGGVLDQAGAP